MLPTHRLAAGVDAELAITLVDSLGQPQVWSVTDTPQAVLWRGDDQAALLTPSCAWVAAPSGTLKATITAAQSVTLAPGTYPLRVTVLRASDGKTLFGGDYFVAVLASPGVATALAVYGTLADLKALCPWIDRVQAESDQAGFARQRAAARQWIDRTVLARFRRLLEMQAERHGPVLAVAPITTTDGYDAGPDWGPSAIPDTTIRDQVEAMRALLAANKLIVDEEVKLAATEYALGQICAPMLGSSPQGASYQALAAASHRRARRRLAGSILRVDADGDGKADWELI